MKMSVEGPVQRDPPTPQSSPACGHALKVSDHRAGVIVSCIQHHGSWQSRLQSSVVTSYTPDFPDFPEAICLRLLTDTPWFSPLAVNLFTLRGAPALTG